MMTQSDHIALDTVLELEAEVQRLRKEIAVIRSAVDPFIRLCTILDGLPHPHAAPDERGLGLIMPTVWPTMGDLRKLRDAFHGVV